MNNFNNFPKQSSTLNSINFTSLEDETHNNIINSFNENEILRSIYICDINSWKRNFIFAINIRKYKETKILMKSFDRIQGIAKFHEDIVEIVGELDYYSKITPGVIPGKEIRNLTLNDRGRKDGTNLVILQKQLANIGRFKNYKDANLIAHKYWGWEIPNYSHLEYKVITICNKIFKIFKNFQSEK